MKRANRVEARRHAPQDFLVAAAAIVLLLTALPAGAAGARNFDARVELNSGLSVAPEALQVAEAEALRRLLPELAASYDRFTGVTRTLYNRTGYLTAGDPGVDPASIAAAFISANAALLGLTAADVADFEVADLVYSSPTGATRLYLRQMHGGLPVYNGQLQINVNRDGRIIGVNNSFAPDLAGSINRAQPGLGAADAAAAAAAHLGLPAVAPVGARLMWLPIRRGEARLVWNFQAETDGPHYYDFTVDADSGQVWTRFDWVADAEYRVYEAPIESPIHTSPLPPSDARSLQTDPQNATASPLGWHDTGSTQYTITRGNNVHAYEDRDGNNAPPAVDVDCGVALSCDFPIDLTVNPPAYVDAAVANLFYWNNYIHDTQYLYGFDEASGNFQVNNFGNGGAGGDDVRAEAQDNDLGGSNCNANFFTPADGSRPRMQMFTCNSATPERDGDLDNLVIVHEYAHGISNRLVGGPNNVSCLNNPQQPGEGWSDLLGLIYTHQAGFADTDARGVGSYLFDLAPVGGTIRTFPYSTSPGVNPDTYSDIAFRSVPHGVGSVWAEIAWEAYWEVVNARGFDPDLQNAAANAGNHRMMLYLTEGMKNTACSPTFIDARDGIIQAAIDNGVEDICLLWRGFARRGLGTDATTAGPFSLSATDGFQVPAQCEPAVCSSGVCEFGEDCNTCASDCFSGAPGPSCPNGICEPTEDCLSCPQDCNGRQSGKPANRFCCSGDGLGGGANPVDCTDPRCTSAGFACSSTPSPGTCCGDFVCDVGENASNCAIDCPEAADACVPKGASCTAPMDCCSMKCKGPSGRKTCK